MAFPSLSKLQVAAFTSKRLEFSNFQITLRRRPNRIAALLSVTGNKGQGGAVDVARAMLAWARELPVVAGGTSDTRLQHAARHMPDTDDEPSDFSEAEGDWCVVGQTVGPPVDRKEL